MTSIGALLFRSSRFPCIKRLEVCLWSCFIQVRRCCACPWVGLADLAQTVLHFSAFEDLFGGSLKSLVFKRY
jgi:hypothetical protein